MYYWNLNHSINSRSPKNWISFNSEQPANDLLLIVLTDRKNLTIWDDEHPLKAFALTKTGDDENWISFKLVHPLKVSLLMIWMDDKNLTNSIDLYLLKAFVLTIS